MFSFFLAISQSQVATLSSAGANQLEFRFFKTTARKS